VQYWLRRNNIDKGPFTKEALLSQGLHSSDLIKIDGDSEWKSPNSFTELQQGTPKPKYKFTADKKLIEIKEDTTASVKPDAAAPKPEHPTGPSPFKRMPSALPKKKGAAPLPADNTNVHANEKARERARMGAAQDTSAGQSSHIQAHASAAGHHQKVHAQVQSLDDAPLRELRHHPTPKPVRAAARPQNSHFFKEFFLPILIIGGIGLLAWWGYKQFTSPASDSAMTAISPPADDSARAGRSNNDTQQNNAARTEGPAAIPMHPSGGNTTKVNTQLKAGSDSSQAAAKPPAKATASTKTPAVSAVTKPKTTVENTPSAQDSSKDKKPATQQAAAVKAPAPAEKKTDTPATVTAKKEPEKKEPAKPVQKASSIADYVSLSLNKAPEAGIKNVKIKVHNTSKDDLNIAVVEIKYYDKDGKFIQGETLQTGKINAGKSATLKVPSSKSAERISYKVSLISGDNVYLMGR